MKNEIHNPMTLAQPEELSILDEIRNDRELIARLKITPQELEALSKCELLGTLSCKDDMLFILRQIREATSSATAALMLPAPDFSECPSLSDYEDSENEDFEYEHQEAALPDLLQIRGRIAPVIIREAGLLDEGVRRPLSRRFAVLSLVAIVAAGLLWEGFTAMSRWGGTLMTNVVARFSQAPASAGWYSRFDRFSVLLTFEALFVVLIMTAVCLRSLRGFTRLKVRPGWRY